MQSRNISIDKFQHADINAKTNANVKRAENAWLD